MDEANATYSNMSGFVLMQRYISGTKPKHILYRCICCNRDRICFYADIRIVFGTVCTLTKALL